MRNFPHRNGIWFVLVIIAIILQASPVFPITDNFVPRSGRDTSDNRFDVFLVQVLDDDPDDYRLDNRNDLYYWEDLFQEYLFDFSSVPFTDNIDSVLVRVVFYENKLGGAKVEIYDDSTPPDTWYSYPITVDMSNNAYIDVLIDVTDRIDTFFKLINLKARFLAYGNGKGKAAEVDLVEVQVSHSSGIDTLFIRSSPRAPQIVERNDKNVIMNDLLLSANNLADGMVTLEKLFVEFDGDRSSDVSVVKLYQDMDDDGVVDIPGDKELGSGVFVGMVAEIDIDPDLPLVFGSPVRLLLTYDISPSAGWGYEVAATFLDTTNFQVTAPDQVNYRTIMHSGTSIIINPVIANDLTVTMVDLSPPYAPKGTEDVPMQALILNVTGSGDGLIFIEKIFVKHNGTNPLDISKVKIYEDLNTIGVFEPNEDVLVGQGTFTGAIAEINMYDFIARVGPPQVLLITYDISTDAFPGHYASCMIEDEDSIPVYPPDYVNAFTSLFSGFTEITENIWSRCGDFDYTLSKHGDFHEFDVNYEATTTVLDVIYGRVHEDVFSVSFPSFDNNDNKYSIFRMYGPFGSKHELTMDAPMFYREPHWQFEQPLPELTGCYSVEYKLRNIDRDYTVKFTDGVIINEPDEMFYIGRTVPPIRHERIFRPGDIVAIRLDTSARLDPMESTFVNNEITVRNLIDEVTYYEDNAFTPTSTHGEFIATVMIHDIFGFHPGNVYWFDNRLRELDNDEFLMHWVFGVCDLNEVFVGGRNLAGSTVLAGTSDNEFLQLVMQCDSGYDDEKAMLTSFKITYMGTDPDDIARDGIKVYDDIDFSGHYESGIDVLLGTGDFRSSAPIATINFVNGKTIVNTEPAYLIITLELDAAAKDGNSVKILIEDVDKIDLVLPDRVKIVNPLESKTAIIMGFTPTPVPSRSGTPAITPSASASPTPTVSGTHSTPTITITPELTPTIVPVNNRNALLLILIAIGFGFFASRAYLLR